MCIRDRLLLRDVQQGRSERSYHAEPMLSVVEDSSHSDTCHTQSLQTSVTDIEPAVNCRDVNSRTDDVIDHRSRRQSRVMNAGHSTRRHMRYSDVESDVHTDSCDDEVEVVNSRSNALDGKQTPVSYTCRRNMGQERQRLSNPMAAVETRGISPPKLYICRPQRGAERKRQVTVAKSEGHSEGHLQRSSLQLEAFQQTMKAQAELIEALKA